MPPTPNETTSSLIASELTDKKEKCLDLGLECHLNWVEKGSVPCDVIESIQTGSELWFLNTRSDPFIRVSYNIDHYLQKALIAHWEGKDEEAGALIDKAEAVLEAEAEVPVYHGQAFRYLLRANRAVLEFRRSGNCIEVDEALQRALQVNTEDPKTRAMILCMKGWLIGAFGDRETRVELLREALELHPLATDYMEELFMAIRRIRREVFHLKEPSDEELDIMEKAFELSPDNPNVLECMTTMYHDIVKAVIHVPDFETQSRRLKKYLRNKENLVLKMQSFARTAYSINPGSVVVAVRLAEVLCIGRGGNLWDVDAEAISEAEEIYRRCLNEFESSSELLHKAGKFYHNVRHEKDKGLNLILDSLRVEPTNFPATMDYLRYTGIGPTLQIKERLQELIDFIDEYSPFNAPRKQLHAKLLITKAALLAKLGQIKDAVDIWIDGITKAPQVLTDDPGKLFGKGLFKHLLSYKDYKDVLEYVKSEIDAEPLDSDRLEPLKGLEGAIDSELNWLGSNRNGTNSGGRQCTRSESELDSDWRSSTSRTSSGTSIPETSTTSTTSGFYDNYPFRGFFGSSRQNSNDQRMARSYDYEPTVSQQMHGFGFQNQNYNQQQPWTNQNNGRQDQFPDYLTSRPNWNNGNSGLRFDFGSRTDTHSQEDRSRSSSRFNFNGNASLENGSRPRPRTNYETQLADMDDNWRR